MKLHGKTVIVTGGASGIGRGLVVELAKRGANVAAADLNAEGLDETLTMAREESVENWVLKSYALNVADEAAWTAFREAVLADFGTIDGIINNAGIALIGSALDMTHEELRRVMDVNFYGMVYGSKAFIDELQSRPEAFIANISSVLGFFGVQEQAAYCSSKFAIRGYTESLSEDLKGSSVHVASIHPGHIGTHIVSSATNSGDGDFWQDKGISRQEAGDWFRENGMPPRRAANIILDGIEAGKAKILVGSEASWIQTILRIAPIKGVGWLNHWVEKVQRKRMGLNDGSAG